MDKQKFIAAVAEILETSPQGLVGSEILIEIGAWDSLSIISFVAMVDNEYNVVVEPEKLKDAKTIDDLAALVGL